MFSTMDADEETHSALVYMAIMFITLYGVQQLERSYSVQISWECEGQICNLHPTRSRCSRALSSIDFYNTSSGYNIT